MKSYTELIKIPDYIGRVKYLQTHSAIGVATFGGSRYLNQILYKNPLWQHARRQAIIRDKGCDLGLEGRELTVAVVHHINPITLEDVLNNSPAIYDLDNLITVSDDTHKKVHYGDGDVQDEAVLVERRPGDTKLW